jgi:hypothetical protein
MSSGGGATGRAVVEAVGGVVRGAVVGKVGGAEGLPLLEGCPTWPSAVSAWKHIEYRYKELRALRALVSSLGRGM